MALTKQIFKYHSISITVLLFTLLFSNSHVYAQEPLDPIFISQVEDLLKLKPKNYHHLDSIFKPVSSDTIKMRYLSRRSHTTNYLEGESYALNKIGVVYRNVSKYNEAILTHIEARDIADRADNVHLKVVSLNMLGVVNRRLDLIRIALDYHKEALDLAEAIENPSSDLKFSIAVSRNSLGNIYLALKQFDLALDQFYESLKIEQVLNNKLGLAINHQNIGIVQEQK